MKMFLTCAKCWNEWTVERWTPTAMRCSKCGSERLADGVSGVVSAREREVAAAEQKESERLTRVEQQYKLARP